MCRGGATTGGGGGDGGGRGGELAGEDRLVETVGGGGRGGIELASQRLPQPLVLSERPRALLRLGVEAHQRGVRLLVGRLGPDQSL